MSLNRVQNYDAINLNSEKNFSQWSRKARLKVKDLTYTAYNQRANLSRPTKKLNILRTFENQKYSAKRLKQSNYRAFRTE